MTRTRTAGLLLALTGLILLVAVGIRFYAPLVPTEWFIVAAAALGGVGFIAWAGTSRRPLNLALGLVGIVWLVFAMTTAVQGTSNDPGAALTLIDTIADVALILGAIGVAAFGRRAPWAGYRLLVAIVQIAAAAVGIARRNGFDVPTDARNAVNIALGLVLLIGGLVMWRRIERDRR